MRANDVPCAFVQLATQEAKMEEVFEPLFSRSYFVEVDRLYDCAFPLRIIIWSLEEPVGDDGLDFIW